MKFLYNIGIKAYGVGILYGALLHSKKAKQWIEGRLQWQKKLEAIKVNKPIWIHVSSLGEFIMAKPLIKHLEAYRLGVSKESNPTTSSFFFIFFPTTTKASL